MRTEFQLEVKHGNSINMNDVDVIHVVQTRGSERDSESFNWSLLDSPRAFQEHSRPEEKHPFTVAFKQESHLQAYYFRTVPSSPSSPVISARKSIESGSTGTLEAISLDLEYNVRDRPSAGAIG